MFRCDFKDVSRQKGAKEEFQQIGSVMENRASRSHESDIMKMDEDVYKPGIQTFFKRKGVEEANKRKCQMQCYYTLLNDLHNKNRQKIQYNRI